MNAQITQMNANMGTNLETEDRQALIAQAISEIQQDEPSEAEKLAKLNETIAKFNTNVSISELTGTNLGKDLGSITGDYREAMRKQRHDMQVYANTKVFEQYQRLVDDLLEQIEAQNRATAARTVADASAEGFTKAGAFFVKSDSGGKSFAVVNEFVGFDGVTAIQQEQARAGAMHGLRTGGEPSAFNNDAIVAFLESADSIQVASFFDYQTKAFEVVAERIMGAGTGEEREAAFQPSETIHGRLGVWIGRPADQQVTQGLIQAAAGSYYNDQEALKSVAQSATGYGELGASSLRPSQVGVGFYTQLWWYSEQLGKKQNEAISASFNEGVLATGVAKFYNTYNPFVAIGSSYRTGKINKELYGVDQANFWRNEILSGIVPMFKANQQTGDLDTKFSQQEWIGLVPLVGGIINSGIDYRADGTVRRGGWKWNPKEGGAATIGAVAGVVGSIYGAYAAEYINKQSFGDEYSSYDQMGINSGVGSTIGAYAGAIAAAFALEAGGDSFLEKVKKGEVGEIGGAAGTASEGAAEAARKLAEQQQTASIFQGAGYAMGIRRFAHQIGRSVEGIGLGVVNADGFTGIGASMRSVASTAASGLLGGAFSGIDALTGVSQRVGNFFSADFNGNRWNFETDQQQRTRAINEAAQLAQSGDVEGAQQLVGTLGMSPNEVSTLQEHLAQNFDRDVPINQAAYEAREVASQFGVEKDGEGILYREVQDELRNIVGEGQKASPADILEAGKRAAESLGYNTTGKTIDWSRVSQGRNSAISADLTTRRNHISTAPLDTTGFFLDPLFVNANSGYSVGDGGNVGVGNVFAYGRENSLGGNNFISNRGTNLERPEVIAAGMPDLPWITNSVSAVGGGVATYTYGGAGILGAYRDLRVPNAWVNTRPSHVGVLGGFHQGSPTQLIRSGVSATWNDLKHPIRALTATPEYLSGTKPPLATQLRAVPGNFLRLPYAGGFISAGGSFAMDIRDGRKIDSYALADYSVDFAGGTVATWAGTTATFAATAAAVKAGGTVGANAGWWGAAAGVLTGAVVGLGFDFFAAPRIKAQFHSQIGQMQNSVDQINANTWSQIQKDLANLNLYNYVTSPSQWPGIL